MSTLNVSLPEPMREFVEASAAKGHYTASEYVRHLIREDQKRQAEQERHHLWDLLTITARQLDDGDIVEASVEDILARGRSRRQKP